VAGAAVWPDLTMTLAGERVVLEPLGARHEADLLEAAGEAQIWHWMPYSIASATDLAAWLERAIAESAAGREGAFATVDRASGRAIGSTRYLALRPEHRGLEIGHTWLAPAAWRTGANVEAKLLMLAHAFDDLDCLRVEFKTDARNERSRAALAALPARFEGIFRRHMVVPYGDGIRDSAYYSVIASEWPAVREHLAGRLARLPAGSSAPADSTTS
jgi:RimJ/RimL family protein N-acetyltransferase